MLPHSHAAHAGSAAEIAAWGNIEVCAHRADAPFLRGNAPGPLPALADWERPIFDQVQPPPADHAAGPRAHRPRTRRRPPTRLLRRHPRPRPAPPHPPPHPLPPPPPPP